MYVPYPGYAYPPMPEQELDILKGQAENLQATLDNLNARIEELSKEKA
jgi:prefoldin subunit 5